MENWNVSYPHHDEFSEFNNNTTTMSSVQPVQPVPPSTGLYPDADALQSLKNGFAKMMSTMERLEQRLNRLEITTNQILKNQQETLQVPFMSQAEIDKARQVAEQLEQDTNVAKQLQAAYNKETEVRKHASPYQSQYMMSSDCPICGVRVNQFDLEAHVDQCLQMFSNDPKKEAQVKETKKKVESGFFSKLFKGPKIVDSEKPSSKASSSTPSGNNRDIDTPDERMMNNGYPYPFAYPPFPGNPHGPHGHGMVPPPNMPMMMPMYMYPQYPQSHMTTHLE